jgi:gliding motility-associated-like protein
VFSFLFQNISSAKAANSPLLLTLAFGLFFIISVDSIAQETRERSALKVYLPEEVNFCINPWLTLSPDSIVGGIEPYAYQWWSEDGFLSQSDTLVWQGSDTTTIWLEVTDGAGFRERANTSALPYPSIPATFSVNQTQGCLPLEVEFRSDFLAFQQLQSMQWDFGIGAPSTTMASAVCRFEEAGTYYPSLVLTDNNGCIWRDTLNVEIRVFPLPQASFELEDTLIHLPHADLKPNNTSEGAGNYYWDFGPWGESLEHSPSFDFSSEIEGTSALELTAINAFGCTSIFSQTVKVVRPISFFIPNAFTPDRDGINEGWIPIGSGVDTSHYHLDVFDPWGTVIFSTDTIEQAWDGKNAASSIDLAPGLYTYRIVARDTEHGVGHEFKGTVTLIR